MPPAAPALLVGWGGSRDRQGLATASPLTRETSRHSVSLATESYVCSKHRLASSLMECLWSGSSVTHRGNYSPQDVDFRGRIPWKWVLRVYEQSAPWPDPKVPRQRPEARRDFKGDLCRALARDVGQLDTSADRASLLLVWCLCCSLRPRPNDSKDSFCHSRSPLRKN